MDSKNQKKNNIKDSDNKGSNNVFDLDKNQKKIDISEAAIAKNKENNNLEESKGNDDIADEEDQQLDQFTKYEEEISKLREEKLRLLAEMENIRKRSQREKIESIRFGSVNLARDILSPNDNLIRALENIPNDKKLTKPISNLIDGLKMVQKEFTTILEKHDVKKIDALNKKFDHNLHQAMLEIETDKEEDGIVVQEIQPGYTIHDRLLRPAMVGVSKKTTKNKEKK